MPAFLEKKLTAEYGANSAVPYKVMNAKGYMYGNQETAKGAAAQEKHQMDAATKTLARNALVRKMQGK